MEANPSTCHNGEECSNHTTTAAVQQACGCGTWASPPSRRQLHPQPERSPPEASATTYPPPHPARAYVFPSNSLAQPAAHDVRATSMQGVVIVVSWLFY
ncbi:hypothetical protein MRX96_039392 [Rhipicephalus microplus]